MSKVAPVRPSSLSFNVVPLEVKKRGKRTKITLSAILTPTFGINGAQVVASVRRRKKKFTYSYALQQFIQANDLQMSYFKPLEDYLVQQIIAGQNNVELPVEALMTFLQEGMTLPKYNVDIKL
jgi:hypothetical protein